MSRRPGLAGFAALRAGAAFPALGLAFGTLALAAFAGFAVLTGLAAAFLATGFAFAAALGAAFFFAGAFRGIVLFQCAGLHQTGDHVPNR
jgi:hypothetical protein